MVGADGGMRFLRLLLEPADNFKCPVVAFGDGCTTFDPVAGIEVMYAVDVAAIGVVDMTADQAIGAAPARFRGQRHFEFADEIDRRFDTLFEKIRKRPELQSEKPACPIERRIERKRDFVRPVAEKREPARIADDDVELVAVQDEILLSLRGLVDGVAPHFDAAEIHAAHVAYAVVVIARNEDDTRAFSRLAENFLQDIVVRLRPMRSAANFPKIDNVADEEKRFHFNAAQKFEKFAGLGGAGTQVNVGNKYRAIAGLCARSCQRFAPIESSPHDGL